MPDTSIKLKPNRSTGGRDRVDLKEAIAALTRARAALAELERGAERAREQSWDLSGKVEEAQAHLATLQRSESSRLASAWVADDTVTASPIPAATHALTEARQALEDIHKVEAAIAQEIPVAQHLLNDMQRAFYAELADAVCSSPEYDALRRAHTDAWRHLRTIRECLKATHSALRGQCPQVLMDAAQRTEPSFRSPGFPVEESVVKAWQDALTTLEKDANAQLPPV